MKRFVKFFWVFLVCILVLSSTACTRKSGENGKLYLYNWTYYTPDNLIAKFE